MGGQYKHPCNAATCSLSLAVLLAKSSHSLLWGQLNVYTVGVVVVVECSGWGGVWCDPLSPTKVQAHLSKNAISGWLCICSQCLQVYKICGTPGQVCSYFSQDYVHWLMSNTVVSDCGSGIHTLWILGPGGWLVIEGTYLGLSLWHNARTELRPQYTSDHWPDSNQGCWTFLA